MGKKQKNKTVTVDVDRLHALFIAWHTDEHTTDKEVKNYADRLVARVIEETRVEK